MEFQAGESGNPGGRPKGSYGWRIQALAGLDRLLAKKKKEEAQGYRVLACPQGIA
jgi:hypothetical protein